jgi:hypothetical protein
MDLYQIKDKLESLKLPSLTVSVSLISICGGSMLVLVCIHVYKIKRNK